MHPVGFGRSHPRSCLPCFFFMESSKVPSSYTSNSDLRMSRDFRSDRERLSPGRYTVLFLLATAPSLCLGAIGPFDLFQGRFRINASIRTVHDPSVVPHPHLCVTTQDGLLTYPDTGGVGPSVLVVGDSTSVWNRYPLWLSRLSKENGQPLEVFVAAREGFSPYEMRDCLAYILEHNKRDFDLVLIKPGGRITMELFQPPEDRFEFSTAKRGMSLLFSGAPVGETGVYFHHHFLAAYRRRLSDKILLEWNARERRREAYSRPGKDLDIVTSIPARMNDAVNRMRTEFQQAVEEMISMCRIRNVPVALLSTAVQRYEPEDPVTQEYARKFYPAFERRFSLVCIDDDLFDLLNTDLTAIARRRGVPIVHSAAFVYAMDRANVFFDNVHLTLEAETEHGGFVLQRIQDLQTKGEI